MIKRARAYFYTLIFIMNVLALALVLVHADLACVHLFFEMERNCKMITKHPSSSFIYDYDTIFEVPNLVLWYSRYNAIQCVALFIIIWCVCEPAPNWHVHSYRSKLHLHTNLHTRNWTNNFFWMNFIKWKCVRKSALIDTMFCFTHEKKNVVVYAIVP